MNKHLLSCIGISTILSVLAAKAADLWLAERLAIIGQFTGLKYALNPGITWGIQLPAVAQEILILVALGAVWHLARSAKNLLSQVAFGMIIGGGLANVIDRFQDGYVTDYVQIGSFPIFNVADSFVTVGVCLLLLETFFFEKSRKTL